jgi:hypothetical protein
MEDSRAGVNGLSGLRRFRALRTKTLKFKAMSDDGIDGRAVQFIFNLI